ncbi:MAG: zinc-dependent alcohol dehydrogenase family protein [Pseudomonadales bacterium]
MRAMLFETAGQPLRLVKLAIPEPQAGQLQIKVSACGVCRTDLHVIDGDLQEPALPLIPGHQIVGTISKLGAGVRQFALGQRVGVPWLGGSCGACRYCNDGQENLCDDAIYTGYQRDGGFAEYTVADANFCFPVPENYEDKAAAPLLCAGLIGHRAYRMAGDAGTIGFYGFGAAAHILIQVATHQGRSVHAITRRGDEEAQRFALQLGAAWVGDADEVAAESLDAVIIFAPAGELLPKALQAVRKGGKVICAGIHMSDIPSFPYAWLWGERSICSVANLTRQDGEAFLPLAASIPVETEVHLYLLEQANQALHDLRAGNFTGAAVVVP